MYQRNLNGDPLVQDFVGKVLAIPDRNRLLKGVLSIEDGTDKHCARGDFSYLSALRHFSCDVNTVSRFLKCKRLKFPWHYMDFGMPNRVHSLVCNFL